ncbi:hypothetical protein LTS18_006376 [Coniosporium uncinatum]|uniref:Uncharacterized protein n=1 Tax=Coniosporium uncinatum TaxID=93489 RepID=A0ACC3D426_9PEZI|nr:hypothetical protein LTS18_006376 [Coniosporium uncinatum]
MLISGFTNARVSRLLVIWVVAGSLLASITDTKYYFHILVVPHLWTDWQAWRILTWQTCYANSTEVLFAAMTFYNLRIIERLWGSRKFASFLLSTLPYTTLAPPILLALLFRPLSLNSINYLPSGPTAILFAILAQYHAAIPSLYNYKVLTSRGASETATATENGSAEPSSSSSSSAPARAYAFNLPKVELDFTSKSLSYLLPLQLALSSFPSSILPAIVGWTVGYAWRNEILPGTGWRVPGWVVGEQATSAPAGGYEGLRRRMEGEAGSSSGVEGEGDARGGRRRNLGQMVGEMFRGGAR